jgi:hypothetical protein
VLVFRDGRQLLPFVKRTLRTSPSNGQATKCFLLRHPKLPACHSGAAFEGCVVPGVSL